jgi:hypothetical protein
MLRPGLCSGVIMLRAPLRTPAIRASALLAIVLCTFTPRFGDADVVVPVTVSIVGRGGIRFRLAEGTTAPCDSSRNRMLFDGWLLPGIYSFPTEAASVCYAHTSGAFREVNWSAGSVVTTFARRRQYVFPVQIVINTD